MRRASQQTGLLWLLTMSAERQMPFVSALEAYAREQGGRFGRRTRRLAELLQSGTPLVDALEQCPGLLPPQTVATIGIGAEAGHLAAALRQAESAPAQNAPLWATLQGKIAYLVLVPTFGLAILSFLSIKIMPAFQKIFEDFSLALPAMTQILIKLSNAAAEYWFVAAPLQPLVGLALLYLILRWLGCIQWDPPGIEHLTRRLDTARILDGLALVAARQQPFDRGLATLARLYPKHNIRRRLDLAAHDVAAGRSWSESLRHYGLIRQAEQAVLDAAQRVGNLPWALAEMADSARRRMAYWTYAILQFLFPLVLVGIGLLVMFIAVAIFLPLIALIQAQM